MTVAASGQAMPTTYDDPVFGHFVYKFGDEFEGTRIDSSIWKVYDNPNSDRGPKRPANCVVSGSIVTHLANTDPDGSIWTANMDSSPSEANHGWHADPGDFIMFRVRRPDGTQAPLKQIYLDWPLSGGWPPEHDPCEHFPADQNYVQKTTHDRSAGLNVNNQHVTKVADPTGRKFVDWRTYAFIWGIPTAEENHYYTDWGDGRGLVKDAHHTTPAGFGIGSMRWGGFGHHDLNTTIALTKTYRWQMDWAVVLSPAATPPTVDSVSWNVSGLPSSPVVVDMETSNRQPSGDNPTLKDDNGLAWVRSANSVTGTHGSSQFTPPTSGTITGDLTFTVGATSLQVATAYTRSTTFASGDIAVYNGQVFKSLRQGNICHTPPSISLGSSNTFWQRIV